MLKSLKNIILILSLVSFSCTRPFTRIVKMTDTQIFYVSPWYDGKSSGFYLSGKDTLSLFNKHFKYKPKLELGNNDCGYTYNMYVVKSDSIINQGIVYCFDKGFNLRFNEKSFQMDTLDYVSHRKEAHAIEVHKDTLYSIEAARKRYIELKKQSGVVIVDENDLFWLKYSYYYEWRGGKECFESKLDCKKCLDESKKCAELEKNRIIKKLEKTYNSKSILNVKYKKRKKKKNNVTGTVYRTYIKIWTNNPHQILLKDYSILNRKILPIQLMWVKKN